MTWQELNKNPDFIGLDYDAQLHVREQYLIKNLPENQDWMNLAQEEQQRTFQQLLYSAPETGSSRQDWYEKTYNGIMNRDPEAQKAGLTQLTAETLRDQMSIMDVLAKATRWLTPEEEGEGDYDIFGYRNSVRDKELAGLRYALSQDQQTATKAKRRNMLATAGGVLLDTVAWYGVTAPLGLAVQSATKAGQLGLLTKAGSTLGQLPDDLARLATMKPGLSKFMQLKFVPELLDSTRGGLIEVARQNILENTQAFVSEDAGLWERVQKNSAIFGEDFLYGMAGFFALSTLATVGKTVFGMGKGVIDISRLKKMKHLYGEDTFEEFTTKLTVGMHTADEVKKMSPAEAAVVKRSQRIKEVQNNVDKITAPNELMELYAPLHNIQFDPINNHNYYKVLDLVDQDATMKVMTKDDAMMYVGDILKKRQIPTTAESKAVQAVSDNTLRVQRTISTSPSNIKPTDEVLAGMTNAVGGRLNRKNVMYVVKNLTKKMGIDDDIVNNITFMNNGKVLRLADFDGEKISVKIPDSVTTIAQEEKYLNQMLEGVEKVLKKKNLPTDAIQEFRRIVDTERLNGAMTPMWVKFKASELGFEIAEDAKGKITLVNKKGPSPEPFEGYMSAGDFLYKLMINKSPRTMKKQIAANAHELFGDNITYKLDGTVEVSKWDQPYKKQTSATYDSVEDLLKRHPEYIPKTPVSEMPRWNITNNALGEDQIDIVDGVVTGNTPGVMAWTNTFRKDPSKLPVQKLPGKTKDMLVEKDLVTRRFTVTDNNMKFNFHSSDPAKVKAFMNRTYDNYEQLKTLSAEKGARAIPYRGQYLVYQAQGANPQVAKNLEEFKDIVRELPTQDYIGREMTELGAVTEDIGRHVEKIGLGTETAEVVGHNETIMKLVQEGKQTGFIKKYRTKTGADINPLGSYTLNQIGPVDLAMKRWGAESKDVAFYQHYHTLRRAKQKMEGLYYRFTDGFNKHVMKDMSKETNKEINSLLSFMKPGDTYDAAYKAMTGKTIPAEMVETLEKTKTVFDELSKVFGVDGWEFMTNYYPRVKAHLQGAALPSKLTGDAASYIRRNVFQNNKIPEVEAFFKNLRIGDVVTGSYMENFSDVVTHYVRQGFRTQMMDQPVQDVFNYLKKNNKNLSEGAKGALGQYTDRLMGFFNEEDIKALNTAMGRTFHSFMGKMKDNKVVSSVLSESDVNNLLGFMNSVTISATMAFRPWPVIRNLFQPFNTLGLVVSQDAVMDGMKEAIKNPAKRVDRLRKMGIMVEHNHMLNYTSDTVFRKFTQKGLHMYQSADHFNRAVTDATAENLLTKAWHRFGKTGDMDEFMEVSKLSRIDMQDSLIVTQKLEKGDLIGAIDEYSELLNHRTQFPYKAEENPKAFQGALGKLFGAYQHYPVYYTANVIESLRHGSWAEKIESAVTTAVTGAAAYYVFNDLLGINAKDFLWYTPVSLTGGPLWQVMNDLMDITAGGYEGKVALDQLKRNAPALFVPGMGMISDVLEGGAAFLDGDFRTAFTKALSAPVGGNF